MTKLEEMDFQKDYLYQTGFHSGDFEESLYLKRAKTDESFKPKYYIHVFSKINHENVRQGYIYFYLDFEHKRSDFIGVMVHPDYRNLNISSLLIASWIDFCKNNGFDFLGTNPKQKKPFLLYLLKKYGFEIPDSSLYETRKDVISICRSIDFHDFRKLLLFKDPKHEETFLKLKLVREDNYHVIHDLNNSILLDRVLMPIQSSHYFHADYQLLDELLAEKKIRETIQRHK